jgi:site-specific DNA-cytosine methylase
MRTYKVVTFFAGSGFKTLGLLRSRSRDGSRFRSIGAFDLDPLACLDFEILTGARSIVADLGEITPEALASHCDGAPDFVVMSPPCKGFSGCLPEGASKQAKYEALNQLALRAVDLALETWRPRPKVIVLENVPRMRTRGADLLAKMKVLLRAADYEIDEKPHDCGEWGGLAQKRERLLLVARHRPSCPSLLLLPPNLGLRPMSDVLWQLPPPTPDNRDGGPHHRLPRLSELNWLRLASIPAGQDWRAIPERVHVGCVIKPRTTDSGQKQNGGHGVNDSSKPAHAVLAEGSVGNTWASVSDPRSDCPRREDSIGVSDPSKPYKTPVIGHQKIENSPSSVADARVKRQRRGNYGVQHPGKPSATIRGTHPARTAPSSIADGRPLFVPTHELVAGQRWTGDRNAWTCGDFWLVGPDLKLAKGGQPTHVIIRAPDGTVHRPMATSELILLQGGPVWHIPGDPAEIGLDDERGQWVELHGNDQQVREHVGNAVPVPTAQAIGTVILELLDAGAESTYQLSPGGVWVLPTEGAQA